MLRAPPALFVKGNPRVNGRRHRESPADAWGRRVISAGADADSWVSGAPRPWPVSPAVPSRLTRRVRASQCARVPFLSRLLQSLSAPGLFGQKRGQAAWRVARIRHRADPAPAAACSPPFPVNRPRAWARVRFGSPDETLRRQPGRPASPTGGPCCPLSCLSCCQTSSTRAVEPCFNHSHPLHLFAAVRPPEEPSLMNVRFLFACFL